MAYRKPVDLDGFVAKMTTTEIRTRVTLAEDLVTYLSDDTNPIVCSDMGALVDYLISWLASSHFKIAQKALESLSELIKRLGNDFSAYTSTVLPCVIDRLGDNRDTVREKAQLVLRDMMEHKVLSPQLTIDRLVATCAKHKNAKVREEFLQTIVNTLNEYGTQQLSVKLYIPLISGLLGDPTVAVREAAIQTLVEIYKHVGDRLRTDLRLMENVPASKKTLLEQKFDQVKAEGLLMKTAACTERAGNNGITTTPASHNYGGQDEADNISVRERATRIIKRQLQSAASTGMGPGLRTKASLTDLTAVGDTGGVTIDVFEASFESAVPQLNIYHAKDMDDIYKQAVLVLNDKSSDWEKRIEALKKLRALIMAEMHLQPQFAYVQLKELSITFLDILKEELRSQVIREACITIAYMSKMLRNKLDTFSCYILEQLIQLIQNSAKVIASSATLALKYIIKYTHSPKLVKVITDTLVQSKSKDIRSALSEVLVLLLKEWQTKTLEKHALLLRDTLKKSLVDADCDARRHSRSAFLVYSQHFPDMAEQLYQTLDAVAQRAIERERDGGGSGNANGGGLPGTLTDGGRRVPVSAASARLSRTPSALQKPSVNVRSVSAVDAAAVQRARARAQYASYARQKKPLGTVNTVNSSAAASAAAAAIRAETHRSRPTAMVSTPVTPRVRGRSGVSQSQPGSRSTSPSTKLRDPYYRPLTGTIPKRAGSSIPRSQTSSRETSPTRGCTIGSGLMKRSVFNTGFSSVPRRGPSTPNSSSLRTTATARFLAEHESLSSPVDVHQQQPEYASLRLGRKLHLRDDSADDIDSEASSVCSERSFDSSSFARGANNSSSYSLSGSRQRLDYANHHRAPFDDIDTIILYCSSTHWSERKDGLSSLTRYLVEGNRLTQQQLQQVIDLFRKMFMDTHTKVYSLFLDTVTELILVHSADLHDWLFILLTRLFNKLGTDLLNSMNGKIWKTLQVVHEYFPTDLQLRELFRIISDVTQTPSAKTKLAIMRFLTELANTYCKSQDFPSEHAAMATCERTLLKIAQLADEQKSPELRTQARYCLIALYNLNAPQMTKMLATLPKAYQDLARLVIQTYMRKQHTHSDASSPLSSPLNSGSSPKPLQSPSVGGGGGPFSSLQCHNNYKQSYNEHNELLLNDMDVQHNIRKTTEEIRNCFGGIGGGGETAHLPFARQFQSLAIASNGHGYNGHNHHHHHHQQQDSISSSNSKTQSSTESNTPESATMRLDQQLLSSSSSPSKAAAAAAAASMTPSCASTGAAADSKIYVPYTIAENGEVVLTEGELHESEVIRLACELNAQMPVPTLQTALCNLGVVIKVGNCELPNKNFRMIMRMLLNVLDAEASPVVVAGLHVLSRIVRSERMRDHWMNFLELILLKIINCYQHGKESMREIDTLVQHIAPALPFELAVNIVNPVIATGKFPANLCAVKLMLELVEQHASREMTDQQLANIFENLVRSADDPQSMVRKAAVFCIVKLYVVLGEERVKPRLSLLNQSKRRLLDVYIEKHRHSSGGNNSAKNSASSAASSS